MQRLIEADLAPRAADTPVVLFGLGAIGQEAARLALSRGYPVVAAVDAKAAGQDLGDLLGGPGAGLQVVGRLEGPLPRGAVALHATGSHLPDVLPQLEELVWAGASVSSSCEELAYPALRHPQAAAHLDRIAGERHVAVAGVGVNPGFAMDVLPALVTTSCRDVRGVEVVRVVDTSRRRAGLQRKTGAGLSPAAFEAELAAGRMGHVGLAESAALLASALGWRVRGLTEDLAPVVAEAPTPWVDGTVAAGQVVGLRHGIRIDADGRSVQLSLTMALGAADPHDRILVHGDPELAVRLDGLPGDVATVAQLVNAIPRLASARPGLRTVLDLPIG